MSCLYREIAANKFDGGQLVGSEASRKLPNGYDDKGCGDKKGTARMFKAVLYS